MSGANLDDEVVEARAARLRSFEDLVLSSLAGADARFREPAPLPSPPRTGLLFANSVVVPFLDDLVSGGVREALFSLQPCMRAHNVRLWDRGLYSGEWLCAFRMVGAFAPDLATAVDLASHLLGALPLEPTMSLVVSGAARDEVMARALASALPAHTRPVLAFDESAPAHQVSWKADYHDWAFGDRPLMGRGLTVALVDVGGFRRDLGNLVEFTVEGRPLSYGIGFGVETLMSALRRDPRLVDCLPEGALRPAGAPNDVAWVDFLSGLVTSLAVGVTPATRGPGSVARKMATRLRAITLSDHVPERSLAAAASHLGRIRFAGALGDTAPGDVDALVAAVLREVYAPSVVRRHQFNFTVAGAAGDVAAVRAAASDTSSGGGEHWVMERVTALHLPGETAERQSLAVEVTSAASSKSLVHRDVIEWVHSLALTHGCRVKGAAGR